MPKRDQLTKEVMSQPLYQGFTYVSEEQSAMNPPNRPKSIAVRKGTLGIPEGMSVRERPNYGFTKKK